jgi:hypothetical protein
MIISKVDKAASTNFYFIIIYNLFHIANQLHQHSSTSVHHVALKPIVIGGIAARLAGQRRIVNAPTGLGFVFSSRRALARILRPLVTILLRQTPPA